MSPQPKNKAASSGDKKRTNRGRRRGEDQLAGPEPEPAQCDATTARGTRCKRPALDGASKCSTHIGGARGAGRPTKLSDELTGKLVSLLGKGVPQETAVIALGLGKSTYYEWLERGHPDGVVVDPEKPSERKIRTADAPFREFRAHVEKAKAEGERKLVEKIAGDPDWRAQAWLATRLNPERFGDPRSRGKVHPDDFAAGESSGAPAADGVRDDQVGPDGRSL